MAGNVARICMVLLLQIAKQSIAQSVCYTDQLYATNWWIVCEISATNVWLSSTNQHGGGTYNGLAICFSLGFLEVIHQGGTADTECGYGSAASSCSDTGTKFFNTGGGGDTTSIAITVMWECGTPFRHINDICGNCLTVDVSRGGCDWAAVALCVSNTGRSFCYSSWEETCVDAAISCGCVASTPVPTITPTASPTAQPTPNPTNTPTQSPSSFPTTNPTVLPTPNPTDLPTPNPTGLPTPNPTGSPTPNPTGLPTPNPTGLPTPNPTGLPTPNPTGLPTPNPTSLPTPNPTDVPIPAPTNQSTYNPTDQPIPVSTNVPTLSPTLIPTPGVTTLPTIAPSPVITPVPTMSSVTLSIGGNLQGNLNCDDLHNNNNNGDDDGDSADDDDGLQQAPQDGSSNCWINVGNEDDNSANAVPIWISVGQYSEESVSSCFNPPNNQVRYVISAVIEIETDSAEIIDQFEFMLEYKYQEVECRDQDIVANSIKCKWFDPEKEVWITDGCETLMVGIYVDNTSRSAHCRCTHLTAFAIIQETGDLKSKCDLSNVLGNTLWIVFTMLYVFLLIIAILQFRDIYTSSGLEFNVKTIVHVFVIVIAIIDIIIGSLMFTAKVGSTGSSSITVLAILWVGLYSLAFWVYSFVVMAWAKVHYQSVKSTREPPKVVRNIFLGICTFITIILISMFIGASAAKEGATEDFVLAGSIIIGIMCVACALGFIIYGSLLTRQIENISQQLSRTTSTTYKTLVMRIYKVTLVISISFIAESTIPFISGINRPLFFRNFEVLQSLYLIFDLITMFSVIYLFYSVVKEEKVRSANEMEMMNSGRSLY